MYAQRLQRVLDDLVDRSTVPHALLAVVRGDGSFRWSAGSGSASHDDTTIAATTPYFIASVDKLFTSTVIWKLHESEKVSLDEPITSYLADSLTNGIHRLKGVDYTHSITVRHLLNHTSDLAKTFSIVQHTRGPLLLQDVPNKSKVML